jgi:hypothetical protein
MACLLAASRKLTARADQVSDQFIDCSPADGISAAPETSARPAGGFQRNYTDLLCARKGDGGWF